MKIALAGNPNSGKTTMYNALTGSSEKVGNWAGVTVEKKVGAMKKAYQIAGEQIVAIDLPGAYSMSPFTSEESVTRDYIKNERPDAIINIVDATNLSRSLFFTTQLLELGAPVVVALNKADVNEKKETEIDEELLSQKLGCPVFGTVSTSGRGLKEVVKKAVSLVDAAQKAPFDAGEIDVADREAVKNSDLNRYAFVNDVVAEVETRKVFTKNAGIQDKIDDVLTNKWLGLPIFAAVMFLVFQISQAWLGPLLADVLVGWLEVFQGAIGKLLAGASPFLSAILVDGIIGGAIAVIGFLPLVMVMYFLIALLEDCGYMARASVVLDPIFKKVGLSGKSVIPFVMSTGCAVPGVMACRTIRDEREKRATAMLAPFMPCGAKLPVIALISSVFFADAAWVGTLMYFAGIFIIFLGALLVRLITGRAGKRSYFIIEMPEYKVPSIKGAAQSMLQRGWAFIVKAATIILICNTAVQLMLTFDWSLNVAESADQSMIATIAVPFAYIFAPVVGEVSWELAAATIAGFIAKENVVGTLAVIGGAGGEVAVLNALPAAAGLAFLVLNLFTPPCFAAIGAMSAELSSKKWFWAALGLQFGTGYAVAFVVCQVGSLISTGSLAMGFVPGLIAVLGYVAVIAVLALRAKRKA